MSHLHRADELDITLQRGLMLNTKASQDEWP